MADRYRVKIKGTNQVYNFKNGESLDQVRAVVGIESIKQRLSREMSHAPGPEITALMTTLDQYVGDVMSGKIALDGIKRIDDIAVRMMQGDTSAALEMVGEFGGIGSVAGRFAKMANLKALGEAKELSTAGANRQDVFDATGWWKGVDDKWKFEIDDSGARLMRVSKERSGPLNQYFDHDKLYDEYPDVSKITARVTPEGDGGSFMPGLNVMTIKGAGEKSKWPTSVALHESQHAIQSKEGFARGGSPEMFQPKNITNDLVNPIYDKQLKLIEGNPAFGEVRRKLHRMYSDINDKHGKLVTDRAGNGRVSLNWEDVPKAEVDEYFKLQKEVRTFPEHQEYDALDMKRVAIQESTNVLTPMDQYQRLAGEAEARAVQKRMDMTPAERKARPFWKDLDIPEEDQIVRFEGGGLSEMTAYHGTPHTVDKFKMSKIGTGEGAQAYGHGLYFAESKATGKFYREGLSSQDHLKEGGKQWEIIKEGDGVYGVIDNTSRATGRGDYDTFSNISGKQFKTPQEAADWVKKENKLSDSFVFEASEDGAEYGGKIVNKGNLYEVDIPDKEISNFLDWDGAWDAQPASVKAKLSTLTDDIYKYVKNQSIYTFKDKADFMKRNIGSGEDLYLYASILKGSDEAASKYYNSLGIKGIKYLDGTSRTAGEGTRNFVVFDEELIKILNRD